ncbi:hypothetical protein HDU83_006324 [Entophlyctis luteolus]|nr:hypothetical protein HDU83_006324 [Entophlyctis luteolus]
MPAPPPPPSPGAVGATAAVDDLYASGALIDFSLLDAVGSLLEQSISLKPVDMKRSRSLKHFDDEIESIISKEQRDSLDLQRLSVPTAAATNDDIPPAPAIPTAAASSSALIDRPPSPVTTSSNSLRRPRIDSSMSPAPVPITPPSTPLAISPPNPTTRTAELSTPNTTTSGAVESEPTKTGTLTSKMETTAPKPPAETPLAVHKAQSPTPPVLKTVGKSPSFLSSLFGRRQHPHQPPASASPVPPSVPLPPAQLSTSPAVTPTLSAAMRASSTPPAVGILKKKPATPLPAPAAASPASALSLGRGTLSANARIGDGARQSTDKYDDTVGVLSAPPVSARSMLETAPKLELKLVEDGSSGFLDDFKF